MKLTPFNGDIKDYKRFMQIFRAMVHDNPDLADVAKLTYLLQYLRGPALRTASAFDVTGENYRPILEILKKRYGRYELLIQEEAHRVVSYPRVLDGDWPKMRELLDVVKSAVNSLLTYDPHSMDHPWVLYSAILYKLPDKALVDWNSFYGSQRQEELRKDPGRLLDVLTEWMERYLANREYLNMRGKDKRNPYVRSTEDRKQQAPRSSMYSFYVGQGKQECLFCKRTNHLSGDCKEAKDPKMAYLAVKQARACVKCLSPGHERPGCREPIKCAECGKEHHTILHWIKREQHLGRTLGNLRNHP